MKLLYFPLILLLIYSIDLKSYSNLDTIIYQKKRIEFEVEFLNRNYWVESNLNELLLIKDYETGKNIKWDFIIYNKMFKKLLKLKPILLRHSIIILFFAFCLPRLEANFSHVLVFVF